MAALVDTNMLVYRYDPRFPDKQEIASEVLRRGIDEDSLRLPHQAILEFVAATTRRLDRGRRCWIRRMRGARLRSFSASSPCCIRRRM